MNVDGAVGTALDPVAQEWSGLTVWLPWTATAGPALVEDFLAVHRHHPQARLVVCAPDASSVDAVGRAVAAGVAETVAGVSSDPPVFVADGLPARTDELAGRHVLLGRDADLPGDHVAFEQLLRSDDGASDGRREAGAEALRAGRVVAVHFMGGLGNQLFQYAAARAHADRTGSALVADLRWFPRQTNNVWELDSYRVRIDAHVRDDADWGTIGISALNHHPEKDFTFDPAVSDLEPGVLLTGYYQSPRYFSDAETALRADLTLREPLSTWAATVQAHIRSLPCPVSLHVRRGDYVANAAVLAHHGSCSPAYYRRALQVLGRQEPDLDVVVFSDDPEWAARNVQPRHTRSATTVRPPEASGAPENLHLLSLARHAVMANSTFSWWGAWLRRGSGTVVAPRPWFAAATDTRDLLPADWITLDGR